MAWPGRDSETSDTEWERVLLNPDNMIVSDSLRDQVAGILANRSESADFFVEILVGELTLTLGLSRIDRSRDKTVIAGICDKLEVRPIISADMSAWSKARVLCGEEMLLEISFSDQLLEVSYDMSSTAGLCFVTLTCSSPSPVSKKRVL